MKKVSCLQGNSLGRNNNPTYTGAKSFVNAVLNPEQTIHNSLFDSVAQQEFHRIKRTVLRSYRWPANGSKLSDSGRFILYSIERTTSDLRYLRKAFIPDHTDFEFNSDGIRPDMPSRVTFLRHYEPYYGAEQRAVGTFYEPHKITLGEPELRQGSSFSVYFSDASSNERDVIPKDCLELFLRLTDWRLVFACSFKKLSWKSSIIGQESGSGFVTIWQHPTQLNSKRLVFRYKSGHGNNNSGEYVWLASNSKLAKRLPRFWPARLTPDSSIHHRWIQRDGGENSSRRHFQRDAFRSTQCKRFRAWQNG